MEENESAGKTLSIGEKEFIALKRAYNHAVAQKHISFKFQGALMLTAYARYVLAYLEPKFKKRKN